MTASVPCVLHLHAGRTSFLYCEECCILQTCWSVSAQYTPVPHNFSSSSFVNTSACLTCRPMPSECNLWKCASRLQWSCLNRESFLSRKFGQAGLISLMYLSSPQSSCMVNSSWWVGVSISIPCFNCKPRKMCAKTRWVIAG